MWGRLWATVIGEGARGSPTTIKTTAQEQHALTHAGAKH